MVGESYELSERTMDEDEFDNREGLVSGRQTNYTTEQQAWIDRKVTRKLDFILLPFLALFNLVNSLDRSNVGNAETQDFTKDAGLEPGDLNTSVAIFFAIFVTFQPVGAALGRRFGIVYVCGAMLIWGTCTVLHIGVHAKWQLILLRIIIGMLEAGIYSVIVSYMSLFYTRYEFARRLGVFAGQYPIAGALGGILSWAIFRIYSKDKDTSRGSMKSWKILFIVEGVMTIAIAVIGYFYLPRSAETAWFFNDEEKLWAVERMRRDRDYSQLTKNQKDDDNGTQGNLTEPDQDYTSQNDVLAAREDAGLLDVSQNQYDAGNSLNLTQDKGLSRFDIYCAFTDWKVWYLLMVNMLSAVPSSAFAVFLPLVVKGFGFSSVNANLMTAPPFLIGALTLWTFSWWSDRHETRITPILHALGVLLIGLAGVVFLPSDLFSTRYVFLCILLGGSFSASPLMFSWLANNVVSPGKRAVVLGIQGWGNFAGVFSSLLFDPRYGPGYVTPFFVTLALVFVAFAGFFVFRWLLVQENSRRRQLIAEWTTAEIEAEQKWGRGPAHRPKAILLRSNVISRLVHVSAEDPIATSRHGENRKTYLYGL